MERRFLQLVAGFEQVVERLWFDRVFHRVFQLDELAKLFDAYRKEIRIMTYADIADVVDESNIGLKGSPTFVAVSTTKEAKGAGTVLKDLTADEAVSAILEKLQSMHII